MTGVAVAILRFETHESPEWLLVISFAHPVYVNIKEEPTKEERKEKCLRMDEINNGKCMECNGCFAHNTSIQPKITWAHTQRTNLTIHTPHHSPSINRQSVDPSTNTIQHDAYVPCVCDFAIPVAISSTMAIRWNAQTGHAPSKDRCHRRTSPWPNRPTVTGPFCFVSVFFPGQFVRVRVCL